MNRYLKNAINKTVPTTGLAVLPLSETNIFRANKKATDQSARTVWEGRLKHITYPEDLLSQLRNGRAK